MRGPKQKRKDACIEVSLPPIRKNKCQPNPKSPLHSTKSLKMAVFGIFDGFEVISGLQKAIFRVF